MSSRLWRLLGLSVALGILTLVSKNTLEFGWAQSACSVTVTVGQSIQQAVARAAEGAVVCLSAGTFYEQVTITRSLTLRGVSRDQTKITGRQVQNREPLITITNANEIYILLEGLTVAEAKGDGISVAGKGDIVIRNSQISRNGGNGLHAMDMATVAVDQSQLANNRMDGLTVEGSATVSLTNAQVSGNTQGFFVVDAAQASIVNSEISSNFTGLGVDGSAQVTLTDARIADNMGFGLEIGSFAGVSISHSQISANRIGIAVEDSGKVDLTNSVIEDQTGCGIWAFARDAQVQGIPLLQGNGVDLCGFVPAAVREPLVPQTSKTQLTVPGDFGSLQEAVDALAPGGTILVQTGSYEAGLTIWKPLTLRGAGISQTTLQAAPKRELVISITAGAQNVVLEGLTVTGAAALGSFISSISSLLVYGQAVVRNVQISSNGGDGLDVRGLAQVSLVNAQITDNTLSGVTIKDSAQLIIQNSQISSNGLNGLSAWGSAAIIVQSSQIVDSGFEGLSAIDSAAVSLIDAQISGSARSGIAAWDSVQLNVEGSQIEANGQSGLSVARGLYGDSAQLTIQSSQISGNGSDGLMLEASARARILGNAIRGNKSYGINAGSTASITACSGNTVTGNGINFNNAAAQKC